MNLPPYWMPRDDIEEPLLLDISQGNRRVPNGNTDFGRFMAQPIQPRALWVRDGISWGYTDPWYHFFVNEFLAWGYVTAPYHAFYPSQPAIRQVNKMVDVVGRSRLAVCKGAAVDVELPQGQTRSVLTQRTGEFCDRLSQISGHETVVYTRPYFVRDFMQWGAPWFDNVRWWLALYTFSGIERTPADLYTTLDAMANVGIPSDRVIAIQTAKMGNGKAYGFESYKLDYDRWLSPEPIDSYFA